MSEYVIPPIFRLEWVSSGSGLSVVRARFSAGEFRSVMKSCCMENSEVTVESDR
jgi:hypothetical protein